MATKKPTTVKKTRAVKKVAPTVKKQNNEPETTGHEWDGIKEYNNPLPRWWVWVFIICIIYSIGYLIYYPAIPMGTTFSKGIAGWTQYNQLDAEIAEGEADKAAMNKRINSANVQQIDATADMQNFAIAGGKALFSLHCSQCHGSGAAGGKGYPSLIDDEWLWGGALADIQYTVTHGIRSYDNEDTRDSAMSAYGDDELLTKEEIADVVRYVRVLGKGFNETEGSERGAEVFADNCAACHGDNGEGGRDFGAPPLNNHIWLYGGDGEALVETVTKGRFGEMPAFQTRLSTSDIKKLTVYVHSLGGGE